MLRKILITDGVHPSFLDRMKALGAEVVYKPKISLDKVHELIAPYDGIVINSKIIMDKTLIDKGHHLKFIARLGSGMEIVDIPYAESKGISVFRSPAGNCNAVAEQALGMLLCLSNNLLWADQDVRQMNWDRELRRGFELRNRTIGIYGFGHTGSNFAKRLSGMDMRILAYDKYKTDYVGDQTYVQEVDEATLVRESDIISFHLPLTPETIGLADADFLKRCKDSVILVNTARGSIIPTTVLLDGLASGKIKGACLDVFENEKTATFTDTEKEQYQRLYSFPNVVLSPHIAGWTHESKLALASILCDQIEALQLSH